MTSAAGAWAPPPDPSAPQGVGVAQRLAARRAQERLRRDGDEPAHVRAAATAAFALGESDVAISLLRSAEPSDAIALQLSAYLHARYARLGRVTDLLEAWDVIEGRADASGPLSFNRALVLTDLGLADAASRAWAVAIARLDGPWLREARQRAGRAAASANPRASQVDEEAWTQVLIDRLAAGRRDLPGRPDDTRRYLGRDVPGGGAGRMPALQQAAMAARIAFRAYAAADLDSAEAAFHRAMQALPPDATGLRCRLLVERLLVGFYSRREGRQQAWREAVAMPPCSSFATARGLTAQYDGLMQLRAWRGASAVPAFEAAVRALDSVGHHDGAAGAEVFAAEALSASGRHREAWEWYRRALARVPRVTGAWRRQTVWLLSAFGAEHAGYPAVARALVSEAVAHAMPLQSELPSLTAEALVQRLVVAGRVRSAQENEEDIGLARRLLDKVGAPLGDQLRHDLLAAEAHVLVRQHPGEAVPRAATARAFFLGAGLRARLPWVLETSAEAEHRLGRLDQADTLYADTARVVGLAQPRASLTEKARHAQALRRADEGRLHIAVARGEAEGLWLRSEQARRGVDGRRLPSITLTRVQACLAPGERLLTFSWAGDDLVRFAIERDRHSWHVVREVRARLEREARAVADLLPLGGDAWHPAAARLSSALLTDLDGWDRVRHLRVVPASTLDRVPYPALAVGAVRLIDVAPVTLHQRASRLCDVETPTPRPVVVYTPPAAGAGLPSLPEVQREIEDLRQLYGERDIAVRSAGDLRAVLHAWRATPVLLHLSGHAQAYVEGEVHRIPGAGPEGRALDANEVSTLPVPARTVVLLLGCRTADGPVHPALGSLSLARAMLQAGASTALGSLFDLDDDTARRLGRDIHRYILSGLSLDQAVWRAQRDAFASADASARSTRAWASLVVLRP